LIGVAPEQEPKELPLLSREGEVFICHLDLGQNFFILPTKTETISILTLDTDICTVFLQFGSLFSSEQRYHGPSAVVAATAPTPTVNESNKTS
jgi:hypothetical protein